MLQYLFSLNGAGIKMHPTQETALCQARKWKNSHPTATVVVEEHHYRSGAGFIRTGSDVTVELPMLVPELTRRHDFDDTSCGVL